MTGLTNNPNDVRRTVYPHSCCKWCLNDTSVVSMFFQAAVEVCEECGMLWETVKEEDVKGIMRVWNEKMEGCQS